MACEQCRQIRASAIYTRLAKRVVKEEPLCWLQLDSCTRVSTSADHIIGIHASHDLALEGSNLRGACTNCNDRRGNKNLHQTRRIRQKPRRTKRVSRSRGIPNAASPGAPPQPALAFFDTST